MFIDSRSYLEAQLEQMILNGQGSLTLDCFTRQGQFMTRSSDPIMTTFCINSSRRPQPMTKTSMSELLERYDEIIREMYFKTGNGRIIFKYETHENRYKLVILVQPSIMHCYSLQSFNDRNN
jgi:hypothetical protein